MPRKHSAKNRVSAMQNLYLAYCRIFRYAQANTTVTEEKMRTKVLMKPGMTPSS
jgi:hypothetical protein